jgi:predicted ATPase with chaperone activity
MRIGDILVAQGILTAEDVADALDLQRREGGALGACLVQLGRVSQEDIERVIRTPPRAPQSIAQTGLSVNSLLNLMIKVIQARGEVTMASVASVLKLAPGVMEALFAEAKTRRLLEALGANVAAGGAATVRYALTTAGLQWARQAMEQNEYIGPAPVTLTDFCDQIERQAISGERISRAMVDKAFGDLKIPEALIRQIGPAVNSGRSILLYGPPGNGKTSIGERIGRLFESVVFIPYCIEVEGQIIRYFDPVVHRAVEAKPAGGNLRRDDLDTRWVACWRPFVVAGGELTIDMLDLRYEAQVKFYEAPLHLKALCGVFLIDDFGRQIVSPEELLNRWIVPMESRVEYLKLHTGKSIKIPFDELVIFSTNLAPASLMDGAFLRRIPYKIEIGGPTPETWRRIFAGVCAKSGIEPDPAMIEALIEELTVRNDFPLANFQSKFIIDQVLAAARFDGAPPRLAPEYLTLALGNLHTRDTPGFRTAPSLTAFA